MRPPSSPAAAFAFFAVALFALVCGLAQLRPDLDPIAVPLSGYLTGDYGALVRLAYYILGAGIVALALTIRAYDRNGVRPALFALAGVALIPVAATALVDPAGPDGELARYVHGIAAQTVFVVLTIAMLMQSFAWRSRARIALAAACFVALVINRLLPALPRGAAQKLLIVLILLWLGAAAWSLAGFRKRAAR